MSEEHNFDACKLTTTAHHHRICTVHTFSTTSNSIHLSCPRNWKTGPVFFGQSLGAAVRDAQYILFFDEHPTLNQDSTKFPVIFKPLAFSIAKDEYDLEIPFSRFRCCSEFFPLLSLYMSSNFHNTILDLDRFTDMSLIRRSPFTMSYLSRTPTIDEPLR